jgi:preprotein translocase subunit YajC
MISISLENTLLLAEAAGAGAASPFGNPLIMMVLMFIIMYFVAILPGQKRAKEHQNLIAGVRVSDHVIMESGVHGIITSLKDRTVMVKIADNVKVEFERVKIAAVTKKSDVVEATAA